MKPTASAKVAWEAFAALYSLFLKSVTVALSCVLLSAVKLTAQLTETPWDAFLASTAKLTVERRLLGLPPCGEA